MARPWLPPGTAPTEALGAAIMELVEGWSRDWFRGERIVPARPLAARDAPSGPNDDICRCDAGVALRMSDGARDALGRAAVGYGDADTSDWPADKAVLRRVGDECVGDFQRRLAVFTGGGTWQTGAAGASIGSPGHGLDLRTEAGWTALSLWFSPESFATILKARLPPPPPRPELASRRQAISLQTISVGAMVGTARLSLAELRLLEEGDVVLLDKPLDEPLNIAIDGSRVAKGRCRVDVGGEAVRLRIVEPLVGQDG